MVKGKFTSSKQRHLVKDVNGEPPSGMFSYSIVIGVFLYLSGHTHPYISFAVSCCAQYMFNPKISYEFSLKIFEGYLKNTQDCGLVLDPNYNIFKVDAYPDA